MVDDLFDLARAETRTLTVRDEPFDVADVVAGVVSSMRTLAASERAVTVVSRGEHELPRATGDADRLSQILSNLIRNAVRHTPEGGIIAVTTGLTLERIEISVSDTGEGIAPEHLPHVFERFYRADGARSRATGGAGLGLAIVRELIELMGGTVSIESVVGEGTTFRLSLRRANE